MRFGRRLGRVLCVAAVLAGVSFAISTLHKSGGATIGVLDVGWGTEPFNAEMRRALGDWLETNGFSKVVSDSPSLADADCTVYHGSSNGSLPFSVRILTSGQRFRVEFQYRFKGLYLDLDDRRHKIYTFADLTRAWAAKHVRTLSADIAPPEAKIIYETLCDPVFERAAP